MVPRIITINKTISIHSMTTQNNLLNRWSFAVPSQARNRGPDHEGAVLRQLHRTENRGGGIYRQVNEK